MLYNSQSVQLYYSKNIVYTTQREAYIMTNIINSTNARQYKNRLDTKLSGQTVTLESSRTKVKISNWLTKSPQFDQIIKSRVAHDFSTKYGVSISEENVAHILTALDENDKPVLVLTTDIIGFINNQAQDN